MARPTLIIRGVARPYWGGGTGGSDEREIHWYWGLYESTKRLDAGAITGGDLRELISDARAATLRAVENEARRVVRRSIASGEFSEFGKPVRVVVTVSRGEAAAPVTEPHPMRPRSNPARRRSGQSRTRR